MLNDLLWLFRIHTELQLLLFKTQRRRPQKLTFDKNDSQYLSDIEIVQPTVLRALPRTVKCFYEPTKPLVQLWNTPFRKFQPNLNALKISILTTTSALCLLKFISPGPNLLSYKMLFGIFFFRQILKSFSRRVDRVRRIVITLKWPTLFWRYARVRKILRPPEFFLFYYKSDYLIFRRIVRIRGKWRKFQSVYKRLA